MNMDGIKTNLLTDSESTENGNVKYRGKPVALALSDEELILFSVKARAIIEKVPLSAIIGTKVFDNSQEVHASQTCTLEIYAYEEPNPLFCSSSPANGRVLRTISVGMNVTPQRCKYWATAIKSAAFGQPLLVGTSSASTGPSIIAIGGVESVLTEIARRKFLVFVNPVSGQGTAVRAWTKVVQTMLLQADIDVELITTTHANHAREFVTAHKSITQYDMIMTVGGDGLLYEVVNGLGDRPDAELVLKTIPLAPIPGGSGNGLVMSILHHCGEAFSITNATFVAIKGKAKPMDLAVVETKSKRKEYAFLMLGWGLISDIDIKTEFMRCLGELRFHLGAVYFIAKKKAYPGRLSLYVNSSNSDVTLSAFDTPVQSSTVSRAGSSDGHWMVLEGSFVLVWIVQVPYVSSTIHAAPGKVLGDGQFTVIVVQDISRCSLINLLLTMDSGKHLDNPGVKVYHASAYRLEPLTDDGLFSLDGEVPEYGAIQGSIKPSAARFMSTASDKRPNNNN